MHWTILDLHSSFGNFVFQKWFCHAACRRPLELAISGGEGLGWDPLAGFGAAERTSLTGTRHPGIPPYAEWQSLGVPESDPGTPGDAELEGIYHVPVMRDEVVRWLAPAPGKLLLDCTFGGGGHSRQLLAAGAAVLALDRDPDTLELAEALAVERPDHFVAMQRRFDEFPSILAEAGVNGVDGILMDVGVSSWQVDTPDRGFSFRFPGPLDMRMDRDAALTAAEIVNTWPREELARIFYEYGEEKASRRVAAAIEARRRQKAISTTTELAEVVATVVPRESGAHPATRVFQALRIAVNDELGCLERALSQAHKWLRPGGRLAVITFHSLEDRIVKTYMRRHSAAFVDRPEWPAPQRNPECYYRLPLRKAITPGAEELAVNPRARSAKLRVAERLP
jgi:16S rRNA (cytosine1402-N4)-methyltransferase